MIKSNFKLQPGYPIYVEQPGIVNLVAATELKAYKKSLLKKIRGKKINASVL